MRNVPIEGGRLVGAPRDWKAEQLGECLTISVLQTVDQGLVYQTTAWQLDDSQLAALQGGGVLFHSVNAADVPVQRHWIQDKAGQPVGELSADLDAPPVPNGDGQRAALVAICAALATRRGLWQEPWDRMTMPQLIGHLARMVDRVPSCSAIVGIPIVRLADVPGMPPAEPFGKVVDFGVGGRTPTRIKGTIEPGPDGDAE